MNGGRVTFDPGGSQAGKSHWKLLVDLLRLQLIGVVVIAVTACATTGSTLGSGVGDKLIDRPPYYAGATSRVDADRLAHLPIGFQRGAVHESLFEPKNSPGSAVAALLLEMNAFLDSLGVSTALRVDGGQRFTPPDVQFGCEPAPLMDCDSSSTDIAVQGSPWMRLAIGRPSQQWVESVSGALEDSGRDHVLVITLEIGHYWTRQKNLRGDKEVRLGTGYSVGVPWLTSLDQPAQILQLTGAILDGDGRALRIGAEGLMARRTNIILSGFGVEELIGDGDVERLRSARRDDLHGQPLVWRVALANLVANLTGEAAIPIR